MTRLKASGSLLEYEKAMVAVNERIQARKYTSGQKLPSMREISKELNVNFLTVRRAMTELAKKGIVEIRHGAGTFVSEHPFVRKTKAIRLGIACRTYMLQTCKHHPVVMAFLAGTHQRCKPPEFILQPLFYNENRFFEEIGQTILSEGLSGVIVLAGGMRNEDYEFLREHRIYVVNCSMIPRDDGWAISVRTDKSAALRQSVEHLRSFGHKRIGFITYARKEDHDNTTRNFAQLAFDHRLGNPDELTVFVNSTNLDTHWEDVEKFFKTDPLPTAVIVNDEFLADVVLDSCERRGIKVPEQLSIVALQDAKPEGHRIPLTSTNGVEEITQKAFKAADLLVKRVSGEPIENMDVLMPPQLVIKASSGPLVTKA